jgi:hypothetical protein
VTARNRERGRSLEIPEEESRSVWWQCTVREMPDLTLELASDHGKHYEVLDDARNVVGHIMLSDAAPPDMPWIWSIASGHQTGRKSTYGYEATCEAAMEAFARVWHRA